MGELTPEQLENAYLWKPDDIKTHFTEKAPILPKEKSDYLKNMLFEVSKGKIEFEEEIRIKHFVWFDEVINGQETTLYFIHIEGRDFCFYYGKQDDAKEYLCFNLLDYDKIKKN